jgi:MraZ protein
MFRGRYEHSVDEKGRTSIPAKFREILAAQYDDRLIVTNHFDACLVAYPYAEWLAFEEKVRQKPKFDESLIALKRFYIGGAVECPIDRLGRIVLPLPLREHAAMNAEIVWVGQVDTIEIWAKEQWEKEAGAAKEQVKALRRGLSDLGL